METASQIAEPIPDRSDTAKYVRFAVLDRVAHVGMVLDKISRQNRRAERYETFAATGDVKDLEAPESENEEMGVNIGNESHYHIQMSNPETKPETPVAAVASVAATVAKKRSKFWPLILGATVLAGGAGGGLGYILANRPTAGNDTDTDTDTITEMDFPE